MRVHGWRACYERASHELPEHFSRNTALSPGSWSGGNTPPISGDSLLFGTAGAGGLLLNDNLTNVAFNVAGSTFNPGATAFVIGNGNITANAGNAFVLTGGITNNSTSLQAINNPSGAITGATTFAGSLTKTGGGTCILDQAFTYTGATTVTGGNLEVNGSISGSSGVSVSIGGTLSCH